jgi:hypothetical protein
MIGDNTNDSSNRREADHTRDERRITYPHY